MLSSDDVLAKASDGQRLSIDSLNKSQDLSDIQKLIKERLNRVLRKIIHHSNFKNLDEEEFFETMGGAKLSISYLETSNLENGQGVEDELLANCQVNIIFNFEDNDYYVRTDSTGTIELTNYFYYDEENNVYTFPTEDDRHLRFRVDFLRSLNVSLAHQ